MILEVVVTLKYIQLSLVVSVLTSNVINLIMPLLASDQLSFTKYFCDMKFNNKIIKEI